MIGNCRASRFYHCRCSHLRADPEQGADHDAGSPSVLRCCCSLRTGGAGRHRCELEHREYERAVLLKTASWSVARRPYWLSTGYRGSLLAAPYLAEAELHAEACAGAGDAAFGHPRQGRRLSAQVAGAGSALAKANCCGTVASRDGTNGETDETARSAEGTLGSLGKRPACNRRVPRQAGPG